jgi:hypothetical protein
VAVLIQFVDSPCGFGVECTLDVLELIRTAVASKRPLGEKLDKVVVAVTGDAARVAESCFLGWVGVASQARINRLSYISCAV